MKWTHIAIHIIYWVCNIGTGKYQGGGGGLGQEIGLYIDTVPDLKPDSFELSLHQKNSRHAQDKSK